MIRHYPIREAESRHARITVCEKKGRYGELPPVIDFEQKGSISIR